MCLHFTFQEEALQYGIDRSGNSESTNDGELSHVSVPVTQHGISHELILLIKEKFDPLAVDEDHGVTTYLQLRTFLYSCL